MRKSELSQSISRKNRGYKQKRSIQRLSARKVKTEAKLMMSTIISIIEYSAIASEILIILMVRLFSNI